MDKIGEQIRNLRKDRKMTLKEISEKTGLSVSFISQVETSKCSVTLESLMKISEVLQVNPSFFFSNKDEQTINQKISVYKNSSSEGEKVVNFKYKDLSGNFPDRSFLPTLVTLQPRNEGVRPLAHKGQEFIYVMEGRLTIIFNDSEISLDVGESIHMESTIPHNWLNNTDQAVKFLFVSSQ